MYSFVGASRLFQAPADGALVSRRCVCSTRRCPKSKGQVTAHELMADRAGAWLLAAMLQPSSVLDRRQRFRGTPRRVVHSQKIVVLAYRYILASSARIGCEQRSGPLVTPAGTHALRALQSLLWYPYFEARNVRLVVDIQQSHAPPSGPSRSARARSPDTTAPLGEAAREADESRARGAPP